MINHKEFEIEQEVKLWYWNEDSQAPIMLELKAYDWSFHDVNDSGWEKPKVYSYHELFYDAQACIESQMQKAKTALGVAQDRIYYLESIRERFDSM